MTVLSTLVGMWGLRGMKTIGTSESSLHSHSKKLISISPNLPPLSSDLFSSLGLEGETSVDAIVDMYDRSRVSLADARSVSDDGY